MMKNKIAYTLMTMALANLVLGCEEDRRVVVVEDIPATPTGVYSITGDHRVTIYWRANNDNGLTDGYGVYRYKRTVNDVDEYERLGTVSSDEDSLAGDVRLYRYIDRNLTNGATYYYAVAAYNQSGESDLSAADAFDTPRPEGVTNLRDFHQYPNSAGFDFSLADIVNYQDGDCDVFFEYDPDLGTFFFFAANENVDIQDFGATAELTDVGWGDPGGGSGWSLVGWMELTEGHSYIVWTADDHYATFRVNSSNEATLTVNISWAYQTSDDETWKRELKRLTESRPTHAANYGRREGN